MLRNVFLTSALALLLAGCSLPFFGSNKGALQVMSNQAAAVYLNESHLGQVGQVELVQDDVKAGRHTLKLIAENDPSRVWETEIILSPKVVTVVQYTFGDSPDQSSYYILQLEPVANQNTAEISLITNPDNVIVTVGGQPKGLSPVTLEDLPVGDHQITLSAPGHQELPIKAKTQAGYSLLVNAQLARLPDLQVPQQPEATSSAQLNKTEVEPTPTATAAASLAPTPSSTTRPTSPTTSTQEPEIPYVEILETGTGWLRVRSEPNGNADNEVGRVDVGEKFSYLDSSGTGWYQIEYEAGKKGWIVSRYARLVEE